MKLGLIKIILLFLFKKYIDNVYALIVINIIRKEKKKAVKKLENQLSIYFINKTNKLIRINFIIKKFITIKMISLFTFNFFSNKYKILIRLKQILKTKFIK